MRCSLCSLLLLAAPIFALPASRIIQDTDTAVIKYDETSTWHHDNAMDFDNTTYSWSADTNATYSFNFTGTGFAIFGNRKANGGYFDVTVDGQEQGHGSGENTYTEDDDLTSSELYRLSNLPASAHLVEIKQSIEEWTDLNTTVPFLFLDYVEIEYTISTGLIREASESTSEAAESETKSKSPVGIIAGSCVGGIMLLLISAIVFIACRRRKVQPSLPMDTESVDRKSEESDCKSSTDMSTRN